MSDFLERLAARSMKEDVSIQPRLPARFEPVSAQADPSPDSSVSWGEEIETRVQRAPAPGAHEMRQPVARPAADKEPPVEAALPPEIRPPLRAPMPVARRERDSRPSHAAPPEPPRPAESDASRRVAALPPRPDSTVEAPPHPPHTPAGPPPVSPQLRREARETPPPDDTHLLERLRQALQPQVEIVAVPSKQLRSLAAVTQTQIAPSQRPASVVPASVVPLVPPAPQPPAAIQSAEQSEHIVHVTIRRVEVRAVTAPAPSPTRSAPAAPRVSLDDYLASRR